MHFFGPIMYFSTSLLMDFNDLKELETPKHWILFKAYYGTYLIFHKPKSIPPVFFFVANFHHMAIKEKPG
jgi:hypothetical protein